MNDGTSKRDWDFSHDERRVEAKSYDSNKLNFSAASHYATQAEMAAQREVLERLMTVSEQLTDRSEQIIERLDGHDYRFQQIDWEVERFFDDQEKLIMRVQLAIAASLVAVVLALATLIVVVF